MTNPRHKLEVIEWLIEDHRWARSRPDVLEYKVFNALREIASDLRGRIGNAPGDAAKELERRISTAIASKTKHGYAGGPMLGLAEELIGRWPTVKLALERLQETAEVER